MSASAEPLETERLLLSPWNDESLERFCALCADEQAMRFITGGRALPRPAVEKIHGRTIEMWREHGFGQWSASEKSTGEWIGRIGLNLLADWPGPDKWEVGYELLPWCWGRGYATEGARAAVGFAWTRTALRRVISVTHPEHAASRRVMEKAGLAFQEEIVWRRARVVWYAIDRPRPA
jgi:ribosomal-protein-alanine N-acetyltransferase